MESVLGLSDSEMNSLVELLPQVRWYGIDRLLSNFGWVRCLVGCSLEYFLDMNLDKAALGEGFIT